MYFSSTEGTCPQTQHLSLFKKKNFFFKIWTSFKVFIKFVKILLLFLCFGFLITRRVGSQVPDQGLNPHPLFGSRSLNHWTTREVPVCLFLTLLSFLSFCPFSPSVKAPSLWKFSRSFLSRVFCLLPQPLPASQNSLHNVSQLPVSMHRSPVSASATSMTITFLFIHLCVLST